MEEEGAQKHEIHNKKMVRRLLDKNFSVFRLICSVCKLGRTDQQEKKRSSSKKEWIS